MPELTPFERDIRQLETDLRTLEAEYTMYFAGRKPRPPVELRNRVDLAVKRYDRSYIQSYADRFHFTTIQMRYAKLVELWDRSLRTREEGRGARREARGGAPSSPAVEAAPASAAAGAAPVPASAAGPDAPAAGPESGAPALPATARPAAAAAPAARDFAVTIGDPTREVERLKELHARLADASAEVGQPTPSFARFSQLVRVQINKLHKAGTGEVTFHVGIKDGKVAFTARAAKEPK